MPMDVCVVRRKGMRFQWSTKGVAATTEEDICVDPLICFLFSFLLSSALEGRSPLLANRELVLMGYGFSGHSLAVALKKALRQWNGLSTD